MRIRIVFVLPDFFAGGAQKVLLTLAAGVDRAVFEPSVIVLNGEGPWADRVADFLPVRNLGKANLRSALPALCRALRETAPDIVISTMGYLNLGVLFLKPFLERNTRFVAREANTPWSGATGALATFAMKLAYRLLYRRAACVISPSRLIAQELVRDFHVFEALITVLRNPVEVTQLRNSAKLVIRPEGRGPHFVCVGRLSPQKGYDRLLEAMAGVYPGARVTIIGEGPERGALEALREKLNLEECVTFVGFDPNPAPLVAGADALLLPSRWEGLPNVALEALAVGTPVIATPEAGGIAEIADLAPEGAVSIAPMGNEFAAAMAAVKPDKVGRLRASLLPETFQPDTVNAEFKKILLAVAVAQPQ